MAMTFLDQQNLFYEIVADDNSSELYPLATVKAMINEGESAFINDKSNWSFLEADLLRTTIADTTLASDYASGAVTITLTDSSTWPTASSSIYGFLLEGDIAETWTGNAANVLSGLAGLQVAHSSTGNPDINPLYYLPSTIAKPTRISVDGTFLEYIDPENFSNYSNRFTIMHGYIRIPDNDGSEVLRIPYYKEAVTLVNNTDESLLPEAYRYAPVYYALGKVLLATDETAKAKSYCSFNTFTRSYEGNFGELLYEAKKRYSTKTARNKKRIELIKSRQSK